MLNLNLNLTEVRDFAKSLPKMREKIFDLIKLDHKKVAADFLNTLMDAELSVFLGREKHERKSLVALTARNYRNGSYSRGFCIKGIGGLTVEIPRDRRGEFKSKILPRYARLDERVKGDAVLMYLLGLSTRALSLVSERLFDKKFSHSQVSEFSKQLHEKIQAWRNRPLTGDFKYLYVDGTNFDMRMEKSIEKVCVLVVIGVDSSNRKHVLALQAGDKESSSSWRELFKDLKSRGLNSSKITLGIMDGLTGLETVFKDEFPNSSTQRCQVHLARNVLCKVPTKLKEPVADGLRSIFYAATKAKAGEFYRDFQKKWAKQLPSAYQSLERNIKSALSFFDYPQDEWVSLRTTNPIERLNKEFKRRTKSMEIVAGEQSCYNLLVTIAIRMEASWQNKPINSIKLPWPNLTQDEITQDI